MQPNEPPPPEQPQYAQYYRPSAFQGSWAKLQGLADGYFGLNKVFVVNILLVIVLRFAIAGIASASSSPAGPLAMFGGAVLILGLIVAFLTYGPNKKIGEGLGWSPSGAVVASVLMGLNSALCCGIIGYVVMQNIALVEMKKFGLKGGGLFGLRKKDVDIAIESLRTQEANMPPSAYPPRQ